MIFTVLGKYYSEWEVEHIAECSYQAGKGFSRRMFFFGMMIGWSIASIIAIIIFIIYKV